MLYLTLKTCDLFCKSRGFQVIFQLIVDYSVSMCNRICTCMCYYKQKLELRITMYFILRVLFQF